LFHDIKLAISRKTNAEIQADWRRNHPEEAKQRNNDYNKIYRQRLRDTQTEEEVAEARRKKTEGQRRNRLKKKFEAHNSSQSSSKPISPFSRPQVKGKMMKRTRDTLKGTVEQNKNVLRSLMDEIDDDEAETEQSHFNCLDPNTIESVKSFYLQNEISRQSPNSSDFKTVVVNGEREKISVRHLLCSIKECHAMF
jgi:hypothetical protein